MWEVRCPATETDPVCLREMMLYLSFAEALHSGPPNKLRKRSWALTLRTVRGCCTMHYTNFLGFGAMGPRPRVQQMISRHVPRSIIALLFIMAYMDQMDSSLHQATQTTTRPLKPKNVIDPACKDDRVGDLDAVEIFCGVGATGPVCSASFITVALFRA